MSTDRDLLSGTPAPEDLGVEVTLRPQQLQEYIGQEKVVDNSRSSSAPRASARNRSITCCSSGRRARQDDAGAHHRARDGRAAAQHVGAGARARRRSRGDPHQPRAGEVLFIDEIHRLGPTVEEILYPALEDFQLDLVIGQGPAARTVKIELPRFTLVGATTRAGLITAPLGRASASFTGSTSTGPSISRRSSGARRSCSTCGRCGGAEEIARRSRGTPRIANRLLRRVRDFAQVAGQRSIDRESARNALELLEVDEFGFDEVDRKILSTLIEQYRGGPAGIQAIAAAVGEDRGTLEDLYEPYLIQEGFLQRTPRGRVATERAYKHLNRPLPTGTDRLLF
jgi:Holliday junction DNA helicase RuvB